MSDYLSKGERRQFAYYQRLLIDIQGHLSNL